MGHAHVLPAGRYNSLSRRGVRPVVIWLVIMWRVRPPLQVRAPSGRSVRANSEVMKRLTLLYTSFN